MKKRVLEIVLVCLLIPVSFLHCAKKTPVSMKEYSLGETILSANKTEIVVQNIFIFSSYKIPLSLESVQNFPAVYYQKENKNYRIIKVNKDGSTLDTIIDGVDSPTYENGYIVEKSNVKKATNSRYLLDVQDGVLYPKDEKKMFAMVKFSYKTSGFKIQEFDSSLYWFEDENSNKLELDAILSDTILASAYPEKMERNLYYEISLIGLIPSDLKTVYFVTGNARIKWNIETK